MAEVNGSNQNPTMTMDCVMVYSYLYRMKKLHENKMNVQLDFFMKKEVEAMLINLKDRALLPFISRGLEESITKDIDKIIKAGEKAN